MLKRLLVGIILGVVLGGLLGFGLLQVLPTAMAGVLGYVFAAATGVLVGLVAGKPIWAKGAQIEAGLKAFVGALLSMGILFGIRFIGLNIPEVAGIPAAEFGRHAIVSLASISTLLAIFYELDNDDAGEDEGDKKRIAPEKKRVAAGDDPAAEEEEPAAKKKAGR